MSKALDTVSIPMLMFFHRGETLWPETRTMATETTTNTAPISLVCGKCSGDGQIGGFEHYADGVCFDCGGSGIVGKLSSEKYRRMAARNLQASADVVLIALTNGNRDRAKFYARGMVVELFQVGTELARKVLDYLAAGRAWDDDAAAHVQAPTTDAAVLRAYVIELGKDAKEASASL